MKFDYKECDMLLDCYEKLKASSKYSYVAIEVPYMSRCIDMVLIDKNNTVISIEFKLSNWKTAIKQARDHSLGADLSYICLPKQLSNINSNMQGLLHDTGVGLLLYDRYSDSPLEIAVEANSRSRWNIWIESLRNRTIQLAYSNH